MPGTWKNMVSLSPHLISPPPSYHPLHIHLLYFGSEVPLASAAPAGVLLRELYILGQRKKIKNKDPPLLSCIVATSSLPSYHPTSRSLIDRRTCCLHVRSIHEPQGPRWVPPDARALKTKEIRHRDRVANITSLYHCIMMLSSSHCYLLTYRVK